MKRFLLIGLLLGAFHSAFSVYSMVTSLAYSTWDAFNSAIFIVALGVLLVLVIRQAKAWSVARMAAGAAIFSAGYLGVQLATYAISTRFFADRLVQLPFFFRDYTYHRYVSPAEYLFTDTNYADLMGLQVFSMLVMLVFQIALAGMVGFGAQQVIVYSRPESLISDTD